MNIKQLLPKTGVSEETLQLLNPVFEAEVLFKKQHYTEASAKYQEALGSFPEKSGGRFLVYNKLGLAYERRDMAHEAIRIYEQGIAEGSTTPFPFHRLAFLHMNAGRLGRALSYCDKGIQALKHANTDLFEEVYFWLKFKKMKRKIKRLLPASSPEPGP
jgi:tetratricopeptide (TPR) repeat protein